MAGETLICDTSFVCHLWRRARTPGRYAHWDKTTIARIEAALLAISIVTIAESRAGQVQRGSGSRQIARAEGILAAYFLITIDDPYLNEWARLSVAARARGVAIGDNDLWIAATANSRNQTLMTCDKDHLRIAPELGVEVLYLAPPV
jgi:predicted nucleic acid-binding protein